MQNIPRVASLLSNESKYLALNKRDLERTVELLFNEILFPICTKPICAEKNLLTVYSVLVENISNLLSRKEAEYIVDKFITKLPSLKKQLYAEAEGYLKHDPASNSVEEVILTYPGFFALVVHRLSNVLANLDTPIIPRLFAEYAHAKVGIDIHPKATIGDMFFIDHGTGTVIGETTVIGNNVKIYQGVTLGALSVELDLKHIKRHPTIEDNVVIYAGATILGGDTVIGHDSTIGGNVWLTKSVVPYSLVVQTHKTRIKNIRSFNEPVNYSI